MEVTTNFKPDPVACECGCGKLGQPKRNGHVRGCDPKACIRCRNAGNKRKGTTKQRAARKALGVPAAKQAGALAQEEFWRHYFRWEVKAGKQVGPCVTRLLLAEKQRDAEQNVAIGDNRPGGVVLMPDGMTDGFVCVRLSVWATHIGPALDEFFGSAA